MTGRFYSDEAQREHYRQYIDDNRDDLNASAWSLINDGLSGSSLAKAVWSLLGNEGILSSLNRDYFTLYSEGSFVGPGGESRKNARAWIASWFGSSEEVITYTPPVVISGPDFQDYIVDNQDFLNDLAWNKFDDGLTGRSLAEHVWDHMISERVTGDFSNFYDGSEDTTEWIISWFGKYEWEPNVTLQDVRGNVNTFMLTLPQGVTDETHLISFDYIKAQTGFFSGHDLPVETMGPELVAENQGQMEIEIWMDIDGNGEGNAGWEGYTANWQEDELLRIIFVGPDGFSPALQSHVANLIDFG